MARKKERSLPEYTNVIPVCPLCDREMPAGSHNGHHLIPATFKGNLTVELHKICHDTIHRTFTEREMLNYYHTIDRLLEHPDIQSFIIWVKKKSSDFYIKTKETHHRKNQRYH